MKWQEVFILSSNSEQLIRALDYNAEYSEAVTRQPRSKDQWVIDSGKMVTEILAIPALVYGFISSDLWDPSKW